MWFFKAAATATTVAFVYVTGRASDPHRAGFFDWWYIVNRENDQCGLLRPADVIDHHSYRHIDQHTRGSVKIAKSSTDTKQGCLGKRKGTTNVPHRKIGEVDEKER